jgi:hypothetical protein
MSRKQTLISLREEVARILQQFYQGLSPQEKAQEGSLEHWSIKHILYHIALWDLRLSQNLQAALEGRPQADYSQYLAINDQDFPEYLRQSWEDVVQMLHSSQQALLQALSAIPEEQLESNEFLQESEGDPAWRLLAWLLLNHPVLHVCDYLVQQGCAGQALAIMLDFAEKGRTLDEGDSWQGLESYNQACYYALDGQKEPARKKLAEALRLNPGLQEWSQQDPDLALIRV